jgi:hypothetical protein
LISIVAAQPASLPQPSLYWPTAILSKDVRKLALRRGQPSAAVPFDGKTDEKLMEEAKKRAAALGLLPPETQH